MSPSVQVTLPHGVWINGQQRRELRLRAVGTDDEAFLVESSGMPPAHRANALLSRCIRPPDTWKLEPGSVVRSLAAGDREALLLHLRRVTFGDSFVGVFRCTVPECAEPLELDLRASSLLLSPYSHAAETYDRTVEQDDVRWDVRFRLPTAGDQEDAAELARADAEAAVHRVLQGCIKGITCDGRTLETTALRPPAIDQIAAAMAELDPQAVIEFDLACPACGATYAAQLDICDFLLRELDQGVERVLREIHALALSYHWSEAEILAMPQARRQRYLGLVISGAGASTS
jgi:hypothetical protein